MSDSRPLRSVHIDWINGVSRLLNNEDAKTPDGEFGLFPRSGASNTTPPADRRLNGTRVFGP
jgi:hypothetical protein